MGNPNDPPSDESGGAESSENELDFWWLRDIYIQALAAGVTDAEYGDLTLTKVIAHIEAERHRRYWHARPIITSMLVHLDRKAIKSIATGSGKSDPYTGKAVAKMLEEYAPAPSRPSSGAYSRGAEIIPDLPWEAAQGVVIAFQRGMLTGPLWASISQWYPRIALTAKRGRRGENR